MSPAEESFYRSARAWARYQAARCGLKGDDADEFEQSFVVRWLLKPAEPPVWTWTASRREPFLRRAARNHALNFVCTMQAETAALDEYALTLCEEDALLEIVAVQPETHLFRSLFWQQVRSGLHRLRPGPGELFARYLAGASADELGFTFGRTRHAVNQSLASARRRLRAVLATQGCTEMELRSYVPLIQSGRSPGALLAAERNCARR